MELDRWSDDDFAKMKAVERDLIDFLQARVMDMPPALALFTLIRCARVFLRKGDDESQRALLPVIQAYLEGRVKPPVGGAGHERGSILWTGRGVN
jgi:hypothetical protein